MNKTNSNYFLQTSRIGFRWWQPEDLPLALDLWGNPAVTRLFNKQPLTAQQVMDRLQQEITSAQRHHMQYWPIFSLEDNMHIGCAGLRFFAEATPELGVHLKPAYWSRGYATEAGHCLIQYAFEDLNMQALFAGHHPDNKGSRNALIKLGFLGAGARLYAPTGLFHPSYLRYRQAPGCKTRPAAGTDSQAIALVHYEAIRSTFTGLLDNYVKARSLDYCEERWQQRLASNEAKILILQRGEQIVGFASVKHCRDADLEKPAGELDRIYIHPDAQGKGQGNTLVEWCETTLLQQGFTTFKLWTFEINARARRFYEKHGYCPDGATQDAFGARLLRYEKRL